MACNDFEIVVGGRGAQVFTAFPIGVRPTSHAPVALREDAAVETHP
ncbi:MAG: hypothetical protein ACOYD4_12805 [Solirubrobacterales bacterium]